MNTASNNSCERLDDFLDGALAPPETAAFHAHLETCAACRDAVDQQRWIDGLLKSDAAAAIEALPAPRTIARPRRGRRRAVVAVAAAAAVVALTARLLFSHSAKQGPGEGRPTAASHLPPSPTAEDAAERPSLAVERSAPSPPVAVRPGAVGGSFVSAGSAIAAPVASDDPQVTVVQLYPTVTAERRWAREAALRSLGISPNGG
jgi:anti-sigma factor RsiW